MALNLIWTSEKFNPMKKYVIERNIPGIGSSTKQDLAEKTGFPANRIEEVYALIDPTIAWYYNN